MTINPIKLIKRWLDKRKAKKALEAKLKKLKEQDPFIYE